MRRIQVEVSHGRLGDSGAVAAEARYRYRSVFIAWMLCLFLGFFGIHKFYLGRPWWGVIYLLTCGLGGLGWLYDLFTMRGQVRRANDRIRAQVAASMAPVNVRVTL